VERAATDDLGRALARLDPEAIRAAYRRQNEFVHLPGFLPPSLIAALVGEVEAVRPAVHRSYIPRHKKGGSVSAYTLAARAPAIHALYREPALIDFLTMVTDRRLLPCPPGDPHACALYFYTEPGDHIGFHYDTSHYRGERFTVLVGLIEQSSSRLVCQLHRGVPGREPVDLSLKTDPGALVLFNGDKLWHAITPLGEGEERVSLTLEYVTDPSMSPLRRVVSNLKDAIAYFGLRTVLQGPPRDPSTRA
jgi:hypothetical protein